MNGRLSPYVPALAGLIRGILSTVPVELRFVPAMLLWGGVGLAIGLLVRQRRDAVGWGGLYGLFLLVGFSVLTLLRTPRRSTIRCSTCWRSSSPPSVPSLLLLLAHG